MKLGDFVNVIKEAVKELNEANVTGTGASFNAGQGEQYATPFAFGKNKKGVSSLKKQGYKKI